MIKKRCIGVLSCIILFFMFGGCALQKSENIVNDMSQGKVDQTTTFESVTGVMKESPTECEETTTQETTLPEITTPPIETTVEETTPEETTSEQLQETETTVLQGETVYATAVANIRTMPSTKGNIVGMTEINREYLCLEKLENGWYHLQINGAEVYSHGKYFSNTPTTKKPNDDPYTYEDMLVDIERLKGKYSLGFNAEVLGTSYDNRDIYLLTVGNPDAEKAMFFTASIHGAEYISSQLIMAQIEYYLDNLNEKYDNVSFEEILSKVCIYVVPMVNPDSVAINQSGFFAISNEELREQLFKLEYTDMWSSNARGVDLNRNFPTVGFGKDNGAKQEYLGPSFKYYEGEYAASEKETQLIIDFVKSKDNLCAYISYHTKGEVIYWNKGQKGDLYKNTSNIVKIIANLTGYRNIKDYQLKSGIDYEWAILEANIPGCTVEIGDMDSYFPVRQSQWNDIWKRNQYVMIAVSKYALD